MVWVKIRAVAAASETQQLAAVGNTPTFGEWEPGSALKFRRVDEMMFEAVVEISEAELRQTRYKYVLVSRDDPGRACWESGEDRVVLFEPGQTVVVQEDSLVTSVFGDGVKFEKGPTDYTGAQDSTNGASGSAERDADAADESDAVGGVVRAQSSQSSREGPFDAELLQRVAAVGAAVCGGAVLLLAILKSRKAAEKEDKAEAARADHATLIDAFRSFLSGRRSALSINANP